MPIQKWLEPIAVNPRNTRVGLFRYPRYIHDWLAYKRMPGSEDLAIEDAYPCLHDRTRYTPFDAHYVYQAAWVVRRILTTETKVYVDIGSQIDLAAMLSAFARVTFVDIRPVRMGISNLRSMCGTLLSLPFADASITSLSSLHVLEHVGLGHYGDSLDPAGTRKAAQELVRVLAPHGRLYVSLPVGMPRVCFNAHRIFAPKRVLEYFSGLNLMEASAVDDHGLFEEHIHPSELESQRYACGLFIFGK